MAFNIVVTRTYRDETNQVVRNNVESLNGNSLISIADTISVAANVHKHAAFKQAQLVAICLDVDIAGVTLYTNNPSGSSPQDTIPLVAGRSLVWTLATDTLAAGPGLVKIPFSGDVTEFYITNAGSGPATFNFRVLLSV